MLFRSLVAGEARKLRLGQFGRGMHGDVPKTYDLGGVPTKILFAPDHTPELEIMKQMLKGQHEVVFAIFTFSGSSGIDDTMLALGRGGSMDRIGRARLLVEGRRRRLTRWLAASERRQLKLARSL